MRKLYLLFFLYPSTTFADQDLYYTFFCSFYRLRWGPVGTLFELFILLLILIGVYVSFYTKAAVEIKVSRAKELISVLLLIYFVSAFFSIWMTLNGYNVTTCHENCYDIQQRN